MLTRVLKYGCRDLRANSHVAEEHMAKAHDYYNALIRLQRERRQKYREIRARHVPELNELEVEIDRLTSEIESRRAEIRLMRKEATAKKKGAAPNRRKKKVRGIKKVPDEGIKKEIAALEEARKPLSARAKELREAFKELTEPGKEAFKRRTEGASTHVKSRLNRRVFEQMKTEPWPDAFKEVKALDIEFNDRMRALRSECGLHSGTYLAVEQAATQAAKRKKFGDPKERPGPGARKIGVQVPRRTVNGKKGVPIYGRDLYNGNCQQLRFRDVRVAKPGSKGRRSRWRYAIAELRIGSEEGRKPLWLEIEVLLDRPVPDDARVTWVYLVPLEHRVRNPYELQLTCEIPRPMKERRVGKSGNAAVRFRWSREPPTQAEAEARGIVVAEVNDRVPIVVPGVIIQRLETSSYLRAAADRYFDDARRRLTEWMKDRAVPEWMRRETEFMAHWRSHAKLRDLSGRWKAEIEPELPEPPAEIWKAWKRHRLEIKKQMGGKLDPAGGAKWDLHTTRYEVWESFARTRGIRDPVAVFVLWLDLWRRKDEHLLRMAEHTLRKAMLRRLQYYREMANWMAEHFATAEIDDSDLRLLAKLRPTGEDEKQLCKQARRQRFLVAPSVFKMCLEEAFRSRAKKKKKQDKEGAPPALAAE